MCLEICDHLNIQLFKIPYPPKTSNLTTSSSSNPLTGSLTTQRSFDKNGTNSLQQHRKSSRAKKQH